MCSKHLWFLAVVLLLAGVAGAVGDAGNVSEIRAAHAPIYIDGNGAFTYANGVAGGSGTQSDPYVIQNWEIDCENAHGIFITNTTAYFVIRNVRITHQNETSAFYGIYLSSVQHGSIESTNVSNASIGVCLAGVSDTNILTSTVSACNFGISVYNSTNIEIRDSILLQNTNAGCVVVDAKNVRLTNVQFHDTGVRLIGVQNSYVSSCQIACSDAAGISLEDSTLISIQNNNFTNTGIVITGEDSTAYNTHEITGNTVNGKQILYMKNQTGQTLSGTYGEIILASVTDTTLSTLNLSGSYLLCEIANCQRITVDKSYISSSMYGIYCLSSTTLRIKNTVANSLSYGLTIAGASDVQIENSQFTENNNGISLLSTSSITITNALIKGNSYGVSATQCNGLTIQSVNFTENINGVTLWNTTSATIRDNKMIKNEVGLTLDGAYANTITRNIFLGSAQYAINANSKSTNNTIWENSFLMNHNGINQCFDASGTNRWYSGNRGNFWDDWTAPDANNDGIVDTPYVLAGDAGAQDNFPLALSPLPVQLSTTYEISSPEIYQYEYTDFTIYASAMSVPISGVYVEFYSSLGNVSASNYTDVTGYVYGTYTNAGGVGIENITARLSRAGFVTSTINITIHVLEIPQLSVALVAGQTQITSGENTTITAVVHCGETNIEGARISFEVQPYAQISEQIVDTDANGSATITVYAPVVENQTVFIVYANASKSGYRDGYGWIEITVNPIKTMSISATYPDKMLVNTSAEINITFKCENTTISNVSVWLSSDFACTFTPQSGLTDASGKFRTVVKMPDLSSETEVKIYVYATKQGYADLTEYIVIVVGRAPEPPSNLLGDGKDSTIVLRWQPSAWATLYLVYRADTQDGDFSLIGNTTTAGYEDTQVVNGHTYYYKVCAQNTFGTSDYSNVVGVTPHKTLSPTPGFDVLAVIICISIFLLRKSLKTWGK